MGWRGPMTHRQYLGWQAWLRMEMDRPSRTDQYIMVVCAEIRRVLARNPEKIKHSDFRLVFQDPANKKPVSEEAAKAVAMAKWVGMVGGMSSVRIIEVDAETYDPHEAFDVTPYIVYAEPPASE